MNVELMYQPAYTLGRVLLSGGEQVRVEAASMVGMSSSVTLQTQATGGFLKSLGRAFFKELNVHEYNIETGELKIGESSRKPWPYDLRFEDTKNYLKVVKELVKGLKLVDPTITNKWLDNDWATCSIQLLDRYDLSDE